MIRSLFRKPALALILSTSLLGSAQAAVTSWEFLKSIGGIQEANDTAPQMGTYYVECTVVTENQGDATSITLSGGNLEEPILLERDLENRNEWYADPEYVTEAAMNADFPDNATYTIEISGGTLGTLTQEVVLGARQYPNVPQLTGTSFSDISNIDVTESLTLGFTAPDQTVDYTEVTFEYIGTDEPDFFQLLENGESSVTIPADTLFPNNILDGFVAHWDEETISGANGFGVDGSLYKVSFVAFQPTTTTDSSLVGAWAFGNASGEGSGVLVFLPNGIYFHAEHAEDGDTSGMERGAYTWNESTGTASFTTEVDTNGGIGLSDPDDISSFFVSGDTLTMSFTDGSSEDFPRVVSSTVPLVGAWQYGNGASNDSGVIVFLENGYYFHAEDADDDSSSTFDGMEKGTYSWNQSTGAVSFNALVDTNGETGLSHSSSSLNFVVDGNELNVSEDGETDTLFRVALGVSSVSGGVTDWRILKLHEFEQNSNSGASDYSWTFYSYVETEDELDAGTVTLTNDVNDTSHHYTWGGTGWEIELAYPNKAELDAQFPSDATYTISISGGLMGSASQQVSFGPETYPNTPLLTGDTFSRIQNMDPSEPIDLSFSDPGEFTAENGKTILELSSNFTGEADFESAVDGPETSKTIPAGALNVGSEYNGFLEYAIGHYIDDENGFGVEGTASFNTGTYFRFSTAAPPLTGAWAILDESDSSPIGALVFLSNGIYFHVEEGETDGIERGAYTWNETTGALSTEVEVDTNGSMGLSDTSDIFSVFVEENELVLTLTDGEALRLPRISSEANPLVGGWQLNHGGNDVSGVIIFFDNGTYLNAEDTWNAQGAPDGMEKGSYTWNETTGDFSADIEIDTNGAHGFSHMSSAINIELQSYTDESAIYITQENGVSEGLAYQIYELVALESSNGGSGDDPIIVFDGSLEFAIRKALGLSTSEELTAEAMSGLTSLTVQNMQVFSLTGLEYATNLSRLNLSFNGITDLSPLAELDSLTRLNLSHNYISDISPLAGLTNLTFLDLSNNQLEDPIGATFSTGRARAFEATGVLAPLANITELTTLKIANNLIQKLDTLSSLSSLQDIDISGNQVMDLTPLAQIPTLMSVRIYDNPVDLSEGSDQLVIVEQISSNTGAEIVVETPPESEPALRILEDSLTGDFYLFWDESAILQKSSDLEVWINVENADSPHLIEIDEVNLDFWRLYQPQ